MNGLVQAEQSNWCIVEPVQHVCTGTKVVHPLGKHKVPGVENGGPEPARNAKVGEQAVIVGHGVVTREMLAEMTEAGVVGISIQDRKDDGEGLLYPQDPGKRPFAVELLNGEVITDAAGGDGLLTGVVAVLRACPQSEAQVERED